MAINQCDIAERNHQVSIMRTIYASASKTFISCSPAEDIANIFFELATLYAKSEELSYLTCLAMLTNAAVWAGSALWMGNLRYWSRVWVTQEIMYSQDASILYANGSVPYKSFLFFWNALCEVFDFAEDAIVTRFGLDVCSNIRSMKGSGPHDIPEPGSARAGEYITLTRWRDRIHTRKSSDARDLVFGYYGCFPPELRAQISIDYSKPAAEVWTEMTRVIVRETQSLDWDP